MTLKPTASVIARAQYIDIILADPILQSTGVRPYVQAVLDGEALDNLVLDLRYGFSDYTLMFQVLRPHIASKILTAYVYHTDPLECREELFEELGRALAIDYGDEYDRHTPPPQHQLVEDFNLMSDQELVRYGRQMAERCIADLTAPGGEPVDPAYIDAIRSGCADDFIRMIPPDRLSLFLVRTFKG